MNGCINLSLPVCGTAPQEATLRDQADKLVGGDEAWLIIDDTALPKKGKASVDGLRLPVISKARSGGTEKRVLSPPPKTT